MSSPSALEPTLPSPARESRLRRRGAAALLLSSALTALAFTTEPALAGRIVHVDQAHPSASDGGPGTVTTPYRTISEALEANPDTGVTVLVHAGTYKERVVVPASGSATAPVVIRAMGQVVVEGGEDLSWPGWFTQLAGNVWVAPVVGVNVRQVFADGGRLTRSTQTDPTQIEPGTFSWFQGIGLVVNVGGGNPAIHGAYVSMRTHGFLLNGKSHVLIEGFRIEHSDNKGIEVMNATGVRIQDNTILRSFAGGIAAENCTGLVIQDNHVSDNNHHGIEFRAGVSNSVIQRNESFENVHSGEAWATGIYLANSPGNTIQSNLTHHNQDSGIEIQSGSNGNLVRQNVSWRNGDHGIALLYATGNRILNNSTWGNDTEGLSVEGSSTGTLIRNNISVNLSLEPGSYCLFVDASSLPGLDADHDIYWNIADQPPVRLGHAVYPNVAAMQAATGKGLHSFGADPRFVNAALGDFRLRADSPAIDAADASLADWNVTDAEMKWRIDHPAVPNTGVGTVEFADRGALENQGAVLGVDAGARTSVLQLRTAYPNPSRSGVTFALEMATPSRVAVSVFDVQGREVWSEERDRPAGRSDVAWGLQGLDGRRVPNGVYMARVARGRDDSAVRFIVME